MKVKLVGFFNELPHGIPNGGSLKKNINLIPQVDKEKILDYLTSGHAWIISPGVVKDILSHEDIVIGAPNILTDGVWAWPEDLIYYIRKYNVTLPDDFFHHMIKNSWKIPECDLNRLEFEV